MTIKEYASSRGISYEAVRQQINRLRPGIDEHITKQGRTRLLDNTAVSMLDDKRKGSKVSVIHTDTVSKSETIDKLKNEIILLQKQLLACQDELKIASENSARLEAVSVINKHQQSQIEQLQAENNGIKSELGRYHKTIFGLYRRDKE